MIYRIDQEGFWYASNPIRQPDAGRPGASRCYSSIVTGIEVAFDLISRSYQVGDHPPRSRGIGHMRFHRDANRFCKGCVVRVEEVTIRHNGPAVATNWTRARGGNKLIVIREAIVKRTRKSTVSSAMKRRSCQIMQSPLIILKLAWSENV